MAEEVKLAGIPTAGLETSAFQAQLLYELLDLRALCAEVSQTEDRAELEKSSAKSLQHYCEGIEHDRMEYDERQKWIAAGYTQQELDDTEGRLVYARNRDWIPKLEELFTEGSVFVTVGAAHLTGKRGRTARQARLHSHADRVIRHTRGQMPHAGHGVSPRCWPHEWRRSPSACIVSA